MKDNIRRKIALSVAVLTVFCLNGCSKTEKRDNSPIVETTTQQTESTPMPEAAATEAPETAVPQNTPEAFTLPYSHTELSSDYLLSDYEQYHDVVNRYYYVANAQWSQDALAEAGLNYQVAFCYEGNPLQNIGYSLTDVNGDGVPELMICPIYGSETGPEPVIFELYTLADSEAIRIFSGTERNVYCLTDYGMIYNRGASGAGRTEWSLSILNGSALQNEMQVQYNEEAENGPWFRDDQPTDEASANELIETMESGIVTPEIIPLENFS